jgi:putative hydrolase of the HAD superfamily
MKAFIFDLDHTLFDRYATLTRSIPMMRSVLDFAVSDEKAASLIIHGDKNFNHLGWELIFDFCVKNGMFRTVPTFEQYRKAVVDAFSKTAVPYYFTIPTLAELKNRGYKLGLITNGPSDLQRAKLKMLDLEDKFDEIIISGELGVEKPDLEPFFEMSRRLDIPCNEMYYVGDNPENDIEPSRQAGYTPIHIKTLDRWMFPDIQKPEICLDRVSEILDII